MNETINAKSLVEKFRNSVDKFESELELLGYEMACLYSLGVIRKLDLDDYQKTGIKKKYADEFGTTAWTEECNFEGHFKRMKIAIEEEKENKNKLDVQESAKCFECSAPKNKEKQTMNKECECGKEMKSIQDESGCGYDAITWYCSCCGAFYKDELISQFRRVENENEIEECRDLLETVEGIRSGELVYLNQRDLFEYVDKRLIKDE